MKRRRRLRICTVGDGDLTFSLALCRALGAEQIEHLTATVLPETEDKLVAIYANAADSLRELREGPWRDRVDVQFGVDATNLHVPFGGTGTRASHENASSLSSSPPYDVFMFNHPHLGTASLAESEKDHADRHHSLLAHYLYSASRCLPEEEGGGVIHLCLCGSQPTTWDVAGAAERNGLEIFHQCETVGPVGEWMSFVIQTEEPPLVMRPTQSGWPAPRRYRNGKLGSKHFLGRYGYRHRRTMGDAYGGSDADMAVAGSVNILLRRKRDVVVAEKSLLSIKEGLDRKGYSCKICNRSFETKAQLESHLQRPALPDAQSIHRDEETGKEFSTAYGLKTYEHQKKREREEGAANSVNSRASDTAAAAATAVTATEEKKPRVGSYDGGQTESSPIGDVLAKSTVSADFDGKRLRWYCRQATEFSALVKSKKQCEYLVKNGRVCVNGKVAHDSSRIVRSGDQIAISASIGARCTNMEGWNDKATKDCPHPPQKGVNILRTMNAGDVLIAMKPSGMRTAGTFSDATLEMTISSLMNNKKRYYSVTKLETGCQGLCYVVSDSHLRGQNNKTDIAYRYSALVFGHVREEWSSGAFVPVPLNRCRRWKNNGTKNSDRIAGSEGESEEEECYVPQISTSPTTSEEKELFIRCLGQTTIRKTQMALSTLSIESKAEDGRLCSTISFVLRKLGHGVVNDRFCKRESAELPRIVRNRLKKKLCIGCYRLKISGIADNESIVVEAPVPDRLKVDYWDALVNGDGDCNVSE